jgi:hypothetical protein
LKDPGTSIASRGGNIQITKYKEDDLRVSAKGIQELKPELEDYMHYETEQTDEEDLRNPRLFTARPGRTLFDLD